MGSAVEEIDKINFKLGSVNRGKRSKYWSSVQGDREDKGDEKVMWIIHSGDRKR